MDDDADLIYVFGGTNDFGTDVKLGEFDDSRENTFCGALNILCEGLSQKYSAKTIVFITPLYRVCQPNQNGNTLAQFREAIVKIAKKVWILCNRWFKSGTYCRHSKFKRAFV